jgi:hypothetical protein
VRLRIKRTKHFVFFICITADITAVFYYFLNCNEHQYVVFKEAVNFLPQNAPTAEIPEPSNTPHLSVFFLLCAAKYGDFCTFVYKGRNSAAEPKIRA